MKNEYAKEIYSVNFKKKISKQILIDLTTSTNGERPKIYLFKIHNKDFNPGSTGTKNLHTLYWEMLFDPKNLEDVQFKLNGGAELFYREASPTLLKNNTVHKKGEKVPRKFFELPDGTLDPVLAQSIENLNAYYHGKMSKNELSETDLKYIDNYSVIKHKDRVKDDRFTRDKIQFHCSITLNFKPKPTGKKNINDEVLRFLHKNNDVHIIGLDRGERHLIYLTMINKEGKIVDG
ncbi:MAG: hypothetical protein HY840_14835, partial [Bacteroidetes bacterium]|nr:hypothetical protein [Bacteroidota bacterium]